MRCQAHHINIVTPSLSGPFAARRDTGSRDLSKATTRILENSGAMAGPVNKQSCSKTTIFSFSMAKDHQDPVIVAVVQGYKTLAKTYSKKITCRGENRSLDLSAVFF